jgi:hypothetical protein
MHMRGILHTENSETQIPYIMHKIPLGLERERLSALAERSSCVYIDLRVERSEILYIYAIYKSTYNHITKMQGGCSEYSLVQALFMIAFLNFSYEHNICVKL